MRYFLAAAALCLIASVYFRAGTAASVKSTNLKTALPYKAIVHINFADPERRKHGLRNVSNMIKAVKSNFEIEVVCHGDGIGLLMKDQSKHAPEIAHLSKQGVRFAACENTMRERSIKKEQLLTTVGTVPSGAVEVVRKQQEGFGYFRP